MVLSPYRAMIVFSHVMMIIPQNDALMSCENTNASSVTIPLSCNSSQWIHVRSETYGNTTLEQGCLNTANSCTVTRRKDSDGLVVNCNGQQTCYEVVEVSSSCVPVRSYKIIYDCVEESLDVCSSKNKSTNKAVYLHSPGYPSSDGVNDNCTCRISGPQMLVQLIEHPGRKKDLNISTDGDNLGQGVLPPVNRIIVQRANHTTLNYQGLEDGRFWIKVTDRTNTVVIVGCVSGAIIVCLLISNSVFIYRKFQKRRAARTTLDSADEDNGDVANVHYEQITMDTAAQDGDQQGTPPTSNAYNNLSPFENTNSVHVYGRIHP